MLWLILAFIGAFATSATTVFAKVGIKDVKSDTATAYRTGVVIICCVVMCCLTGSFNKICTLSLHNWVFIALSGIATGCSWLCYYKALKKGDINKIAPIDKSSFILTSILFLIFFFEDTTKCGNITLICMLALSVALMFSGTLLMIDLPAEKNKKNGDKTWLVYAVLSAVFASLVAVFIKAGLKDIPSDLGTLLRTVIVFVFSSAIVFAKKEHKDFSSITTKSLIFLTLSGIATGVAWLSEYYALNTVGVNPVTVNAIGKFSVVITMLFSAAFFKEKFTKKTVAGLILLISGIAVITIFSL